MMTFEGFLWLLVTVLGPALLAATLAWALWRNKRSKIPKEVTAAGTRQLRREEDAAQRAGVDGEE
jgi:hypothetical protein